MRIVYSPTGTELPVFDSTSGNNSLYDKVIVHQLSALALDSKSKVHDGGMGFVIRLNDGRFIIIDGGKNTAENADAIYNYLKQLQPSGTIKIASWILTHAHSDHTGAFVGFLNSYASKVTIETILFNPCDTTEQTKYASLTASDVYSAISAKCPSAKVYKPLSGQKFTFSKTTIEILYTMSDFLPNVIVNESDAKITYEQDAEGNDTVVVEDNSRNGNGNIQSMVFMIDLVNEGETNNNLVVTGDATSDAFNEICARYGSYIESKYVQISHHGHAINPAGSYIRRNNSTREFYDLVKPEIAFWPAPKHHVYGGDDTATDEVENRPSRSEVGVNAYLIETYGPTIINASSSAADRTITVK
jgi:beta-lactamase superfamily II metal-dependent hydrolase